MTIEISQLFIYPVKSLRGIAVSEAELTATGFKWDRHWMITKSDGGFVTQRQFSKMTLIQTKLTASTVILSKAGMSDLIIPLRVTSTVELSETSFEAKIWKDFCNVVDEGEEASNWITEAVSAPKALRLVRMADGYKRPQSKPEMLGISTHTLFADAAPILVCNADSLKALNKSLVGQRFDAVEMDNFRPNIVLKGLSAFEEHNLRGLKHEHYELRHCYPCQRCIIPTINVFTGVKNPHQEPFSLLARLNAMPDNKKAPAFGENTIVVQGIGKQVHVGDLLKCSQDS